MINPPKFSVGICGGGIGGLCLAVALARFTDVQVDLYEAAERFKEIGAGVMIWEKTWRILELLGLDADFSRIAHSPPDGSIGVGFDYRRSDQPSEGFRFRLVEMPYGCIRFHRADFLDVFVDHLPPNVAHFGKRLVSYAQEERDKPITLYFNDGSTATCDVLVGCDGIKSSVRKQMFEDMVRDGLMPSDVLDRIEPFWSGSMAYRGLIPVERLLQKDESGTPHRTITYPMMYCGKSKHVVSYSISQGTLVNVITFVSEPEKEGRPHDGPWVCDVPKQELLDHYAGWEPEVETLLNAIEKPTKWAIHQLPPLPCYVSDRVALVGDAAHAMMPHQGAGAGQAIEDAFVLAGLLGHPQTTTTVTAQTLSRALCAYEAVRLPMAAHVLQGSRAAGLMYEFNGPDGEAYERLGPAIQKQWDWIWASTPEQDLQRAVERMQAMVC